MITLRGLTGADFEGEARVKRGHGLFAIFSFCSGERAWKSRYVLVKGTNLFIFANENAPTPAYAVELPHKRIALNDKHGNTQTVTIETNLGDVEYEVKFDLRENAAVAKNFAMALKEEVAVGNTNEIKKKLGHSTIHKSKSIKYADTVAAQKIKDQPDSPDAHLSEAMTGHLMPDIAY